ncbi:hypothetical protein LSAT2_013098, partial [Lamellibrachia satsuma]
SRGSRHCLTLSHTTRSRGRVDHITLGRGQSPVDLRPPTESVTTTIDQVHPRRARLLSSDDYQLRCDADRLTTTCARAVIISEASVQADIPSTAKTRLVIEFHISHGCWRGGV